MGVVQSADSASQFNCWQQCLSNSVHDFIRAEERRELTCIEGLNGSQSSKPLSCIIGM